MSQTDFVNYDQKTPGDRTVMHVLYALHTVAWASLGTLAVIALIVNYIKRADETDALYASHHSYMISTFWWTILWLVVTSPLYLLFIMPGVIAHGIVGLWYLYRCIRGWLRFTNGNVPS
ncbi:DUF4870 family protein [Ramlibacter tataouinensis]|uniref:Transmembrane protein n=1 Tax=Ramlibacter tataouinensis (strain ATCC BAA-407 / DSM 14655 / LMG 21543 / TTB310) TaxID=365046 RepID=F5XYC0_RAMTT|nr:membrane protein [Ramlibacter tataouinensis]AEG91913.1 Conserved hypothetical protein [Ramlibacter tataouinensis TTB310]